MSRIICHRISGSIVVLAACTLFAMLVPAAATAQAGGECPLTLHVSYVPVQQLSIGDVDFDHFESRTLLFTLDIGNQSGTTINASLTLRLEIRLANGTTYSHPPALVFISKPFAIRAEGRSLTNLDIGQHSTQIKDSVFTIRDDFKSFVQNIALASGRFPAGRYSFFPELTCSNGGTVTSDPIIYDIQNPSRVELRAPDDGETTNEFPLFEFYSDAARNVLTVAEKAPGQSKDDAIQRRPPMLSVELMNRNSFFYAGGRPLEPGKTYVWQVAGKLLGAGNAELDINSTVNEFTVSRTSTPGTDDQLLNQLEELFGQRYPDLFKQIRAGQFAFTGKFFHEGSVIDLQSLFRLLNDLRTNSDNVELSFE